VDGGKKIRLHAHELALDLGPFVDEGLIGLSHEAGGLDDPFEAPDVLKVFWTKLAVVPTSLLIVIPTGFDYRRTTKEFQVDGNLFFDGFPHGQDGDEAGDAERYAQKYPSVASLIPHYLPECHPE